MTTSNWSEATGSSRKVSAVLITRENEWPTDIKLDFEFDEVLVMTHCPSLACRFQLAQQARNEIIYVQDDDCQIDIKELWTHYDGRLTNAIKWGHQQIYAGTGVTLIGWGCFFPKSLIDFSRWTAQYGDIVQGGLAHEVDRIFTYLAQPHNTVRIPIEDLTRTRAMSRDNPDHYRSKDRVIGMLKELL